jgi:malonyl CoA-acyl carrier protein transacylase
MTIPTPAGPLVLADSIRDLPARNYLLFNQACVRENGLGTDIYDADSHISRLGLFLHKKETDLAQGEFNNLLLGLENLAGADAAHPERPEAQHLQAAVLAPLVVSIAGVAFTDNFTQDGLRRAHNAILATGISQGALEQAVEDSKKKFMRNSS